MGAERRAIQPTISLQEEFCRQCVRLLYLKLWLVACFLFGCFGFGVKNLGPRYSVSLAAS